MEKLFYVDKQELIQLLDDQVRLLKIYLLFSTKLTETELSAAIMNILERR